MNDTDATKRAHELLGPSKECQTYRSTPGVWRCTKLCHRLQANELEHARDLEEVRRSIEEVRSTLEGAREEIASLRSEPDMVAEAEEQVTKLTEELKEVRAELAEEERDGRLAEKNLDKAWTERDALKVELADLRASLPDLQAHAHGMGQECEAERAEKDLGAAVGLFGDGLQVAAHWEAFVLGKDVAPFMESAGWAARMRAFLGGLRLRPLPNLAEPPAARVDSEATASAKPEAR